MTKAKSYQLQHHSTKQYDSATASGETLILLENAYAVISRGKCRHTSKCICAYKL